MKFRAHTEDRGAITWCNDNQLRNYKKTMYESRNQVFIMISVGGTVRYPASIYLLKLADAGYDSKENWNRYSRMGIKVCININSTQISEKHAVKYLRLIRSHGCVVRGNNMRRILEVGRDQWKLENGYGMRWSERSQTSRGYSWTY